MFFFQSYDNNQEMTEADILSLSDSDLRAKLKSYDENVGPITSERIFCDENCFMISLNY